MEIYKRVEQLLKQAGVKYRFIPLPENLPMDIASHMAFHHDTLEHAMATILYRTEKGLIAAVKRADTEIDEHQLQTLAGVKSMKFASNEDLASLGLIPGIVPYLGLDIPYFVDKNILSVGKVYGTPGSKILGMVMDAKDMIKVNNGIVGSFTKFIRTINIHGDKRYRIVSGITPSGDGSLHIGNYLGAVRQFIEIAKTNECFLFVADLHALTTIQNKETLRKNTETLILNELSLLGDLTNIIFFRQSDIGVHPELQTIISNVTPLGLLKRAHAYKDKLAKDVMEDDINLGLFNYPILMAADILMYKPDLVPVGKDQKQHVEITRDIAQKFNTTFNKQVFKLPDAYIPEEVATILGTDGKRKMSKSLGNIISIFEPENVIKKQVMGTYTDPTRIHAHDPGHIEGNMVFTYLDYFDKQGKAAELKAKYIKGEIPDVEVKEYLFSLLMAEFGDARRRYEDLKAHPEKVKKILEDGAARAREVAATTMSEVREAIGLTNQYSFFQYQFPKSNGKISIDEFAKVDVRVGKVEAAENVEKSEKLIRLHVDFKEGGKRIIFTGVRQFGYTPEFFTGKQFLFVYNLEPRRMMGEESQGMIVAVDSPRGEAGGSDKPIFLSGEGMPIGSRIR